MSEVAPKIDLENQSQGDISQTPQRLRAELVLAVCALIWGATFSLSKTALSEVSPFLLIALRFAVAAPIAAIFAYRHLARIDRSLFFSGVFLGILMFAGHATQTLGLRYTTASRSAFITQLLMIFTPLFQWLILRKRPHLANAAGAVTVGVGLYFLTAPEAGGFNRGDAWTLLCAVICGAYIVALDLITRRHPVMPLVFLQIVTTGILAGSASLLEDPFLNGRAGLLLEVLYLGLPATALVIYLQSRYQQHSTPMRASIIFALEPVFGAIFAYLLLQERLGTYGTLGAILILVGIMISELADPVILFVRDALKRKAASHEAGVDTLTSVLKVDLIGGRQTDSSRRPIAKSGVKINGHGRLRDKARR